MNPVYPFSSFMEKEVDPNLKLYIFSPSSQASSSSQLAYATCFSTTQHDQRGNHLQESHQLRHDHQAEKSLGGSSEDCQVISSTCLLKSSVSSCNTEPRPREAIDRSRDDHQDLEDQSKPDNVSAKYWMSSKMRLMQKMMINTDKKAAANSDHKPASTARNIQNVGNHRHGKWEITRSCSNGHNNGVRVCGDCNTTTTPLWRSGPQGPKSLCNACGIRQRKARRAMAEAASGGSSVVVASEAPLGKQHKQKKSRTSWHGDAAIVSHVKNKSSKVADNSSDSQTERNGNVSFDHNFTLRLSKSSSAFGRVFPRDEEEAAILLMELSCGLVHSC